MLRFLVHNALLAVDLVLCAFAGLAWRDADVLARAGVLASATIVEKHEEIGGKGNTVYSVTYELIAPIADGREGVLREKRRVSKALFDQSQIGGAIAVRYLPDEPDKNDVDGSNGGAIEVSAVAFCVTFIGSRISTAGIRGIGGATTTDPCRACFGDGGVR